MNQFNSTIEFTSTEQLLTLARRLRRAAIPPRCWVVVGGALCAVSTQRGGTNYMTAFAFVYMLQPTST